MGGPLVWTQRVDEEEHVLDVHVPIQRSTFGGWKQDDYGDGGPTPVQLCSRKLHVGKHESTRRVFGHWCGKRDGERVVERRPVEGAGLLQPPAGPRDPTIALLVVLVGHAPVALLERKGSGAGPRVERGGRCAEPADGEEGGGNVDRVHAGLGEHGVESSGMGKDGGEGLEGEGGNNVCHGRVSGFGLDKHDFHGMELDPVVVLLVGRVSFGVAGGGSAGKRRVGVLEEERADVGVSLENGGRRAEL